MFRKNYKATLKSIFRSPVTFLAFGATIILILSLYDGVSNGPQELDRIRNNIFNHIRTSCSNLFPAFIGIIISANLFAEKINGFSDLLLSSRRSFLTFYLSKLCAFVTVSLIVRCMYLTAQLIWYWGSYYPANCVAGEFLTFRQILACYASYEMAYLPLLLLAYIAMPTFITAATNIPAAGAVWNVAYYLLGFASLEFKQSDFYLPPETVDAYLGTFTHIDDLQYMLNYQAGLYPNVLGEVPPLQSEALRVYIIWMAVSLVLLTVSYFILKRRYRT
ncbi:MAG: hypothetical protein IJC53_03275 [Clostridia bacterium]|nr:hypothetical protein [Clostridia bacterium]